MASFEHAPSERAPLRSPPSLGHLDVVPWGTLLLSVLLYIVVPVIVAQLIRRAALRKGQGTLEHLMKQLGPISLIALLTTLVLLFGFQGDAILAQPLVIGLLAVPIFIQVYLNAGIAY